MLNTYQDRGFDRSSIYSTAFIPAKNTLFSSRQMDRQHFNYRSSSLALKAIGSQRNNHKPVNLQISKTQVYENALVNSLVGKLITVDRDQKKKL